MLYTIIFLLCFYCFTCFFVPYFISVCKSVSPFVARDEMFPFLEKPHPLPLYFVTIGYTSFNSSHHETHSYIVSKLFRFLRPNLVN